jgi:hypothetical protein
MTEDRRSVNPGMIRGEEEWEQAQALREEEEEEEEEGREGV